MSGVTLPEQRQALLKLARDSIAHGLRHGKPLRPDPSSDVDSAVSLRASFVTLMKEGNLRGCIGTLHAHRPLLEDVAHNAFQAAFRDPRFAPLEQQEYMAITIHLSILGTPETMNVSSEAELIRQLRPGKDGLILRDGSYAATFLPSVWESIADPEEFLFQLKRKAGLRPGHWSRTLTVQRYVTEYFGESKE